MDRVTELSALLRQEVADYVRPSPTSRVFFLENPEEQTYAVISVLKETPYKAFPIVMARVAHDKVIIEADTTSHPLYEELKRKGIPETQIILAYRGEKLPDDV